MYFTLARSMEELVLRLSNSFLLTCAVMIVKPRHYKTSSIYPRDSKNDLWRRECPGNRLRRWLLGCALEIITLARCGDRFGRLIGECEIGHFKLHSCTSFCA